MKYSNLTFWTKLSLIAACSLFIATMTNRSQAQTNNDSNLPAASGTAGNNLDAKAPIGETSNPALRSNEETTQGTDTQKQDLHIDAPNASVDGLENHTNLEGPAVPQKKVITLQQALEKAASQNPSFKNVDEMVLQADLSINSAWAMILPNLSVGAQLIRNKNESKMVLPIMGPISHGENFDFTDPNEQHVVQMSMEEMTLQKKWSHNYNLTANLTLFNARAIPLIKYAYDNTDKARLEAQIQKNNFLFAVTAAYYQLQSMEEMVAVAAENLQLSQTFLEQANARKLGGQATRIDVLRAELQVLDAQKALEDAKDAVVLSKSALNSFINEPQDFDIEAPAQLSPNEADQKKFVAMALDKRVEIKKAHLENTMAKRLKKETQFKWIPSFDVTYQWTWNSDAGFSGEHNNWMLIFGAKWSILEGGGRFAELKIRDSQIRMTRNNIEQVKLNIKKEVERDFLETKKQKRNVEVADKQVALSEENHRLISKQYEAGIITSLDLLAAASDLTNKRVMQVLQQLQYDIAQLSLKKTVGEYSALSFSQPN